MSEQNDEACKQADKPARKDLIHRALKAIAGEAWSNPLIFAGLGGFIGVSALCGFGEASLPASKWQQLVSATAAGIVVAGGALASGTLLGFLFGIPRSISDPKRAYQENTNLEQVSDWLTKIVIALGLAQLTKIPSAFLSVAVFVSRGIGLPVVTPSLAGIILLYFGIVGFLIAYLWTRLYLTHEFTRADRAAQETPEFLEGLVEALLYQPQPDGFLQAIQRSDDYLKRYGDHNWRIWRSRACAFGQKYGYLPAGQRDSPEGKESRNEALQAIGRALRLNPAEKEGLRRLWDPSLATPEESDLVVFFKDDAFEKLLG